MEPTAREVKDSRDYCRDMVAKMARCDHLNPLSYETTFEDSAERLRGMGISTDALTIEQEHKLSYAMGTPFGICGEAHNYLHGRGVEQSYQKAVNLYAKAAWKGSAEGLYNLALLTSEGKGVKRNISESTRYLFQAAGKDPLTEKFPGSGIIIPNVGVMESQHALGIAYEHGVGVEVNVTKAIEWYEKALLNGCGSSGNNLALMYLNGKVIPRNVERAFQFWKVAALKGCVRAMDNLALHYLRNNLKEAQKWYILAVQNKSMLLPMRRKDFMMDEFPLENFNGEEFLKNLLEDLMRGPLKKFARPNKYGYAVSK